jgi:dolichol kinase
MVSTGDLVGLILVYSYIIIVILIATLIRRKYPASGYRKVIHILVGNVVFIWWVFDSSYVMAFLAAGPFVFLLLLVTPYSPISKLDNNFLRAASAQGHGYGLVFYAVSWTILALVLFEDLVIASIAIVAMSYGDGLGGLVGKRYGRRKIWKDKSYLGTVTVACGTFVATLAVIMFYTYLGGMIPSLYVFPYSLAEAVGLAVVVGVFVALVELFSPGEYDNLTVPLLTAALVLGLQELLTGGVA